MLSVVMLNVTLHNAVMLRFVMLNVVAPWVGLKLCIHRQFSAAKNASDETRMINPKLCLHNRFSATKTQAMQRVWSIRFVVLLPKVSRSQATEAGSLNKRSCLAAALIVTEFVTVIAKILLTLCCAAQVWPRNSTNPPQRPVCWRIALA